MGDACTSARHSTAARNEEVSPRRPGACAHLELVLLVLGAFVERPVVAELPDVVHFVEAFDVVGDAVSLQHLLALGDGGHGVDLQIWGQASRRKPRSLGKHHTSLAPAELWRGEGVGNHLLFAPLWLEVN